MKIVVGKYYRTRDGRKVGPMKSRGMWGSFFEYNGSIWFSDGSFHHDAESKHDLIAEWVDSEHIESTKRMIEASQDYVDRKPIEGRYGSEDDRIAEWVDNSHIERTKRMIEVMQAYVDGKDIERVLKKDIEVIGNGEAEWNWQVFEYRIAETKTPDSINWDHVAPEFKYMARDGDGITMLYKRKPDKCVYNWYTDGGEVCEASSNITYKRGTVDWKDSLVIRPGCE